MHKLGKLLAAGLSLGLVAAGLILLPKQPVKAQAPPPLPLVVPVRVVNTPLSVTSTISGTPNVNVANTPLPVTSTITGTPNVNVTNTPLPVTGSVALSGNTAASPLFVQDVDSPARQPFVGTCSASHTNGNITFPCLIAIPTNSELVIQTVSTIYSADPGSATARFELLTCYNHPISGGCGYSSFAELHDDGMEPGYSQGVGTFAWTIYHGVTAFGTYVQCSWQTVNSNPINGLGGECTVFGYLIPLS
jgi:hypothetical protein